MNQSNFFQVDFQALDFFLCRKRNILSIDKYFTPASEIEQGSLDEKLKLSAPIVEKYLSLKPLLKLDWCIHEATDYAVKRWHYSKCLPPSKQKAWVESIRKLY